MASGFKIAQAYVTVTLDRDELPAELEYLAAELSGATDAIGKEAGQRLGYGIRDGIGDAPVAEPATRKGVEAGGRFGDAFKTRMRAALASLPPVGVPIDDKDVQAKLDFIRAELKSLSDQRIGIDISETDALAKLSMLRAQMDDLRAMSPSVQVDVDTRAASAEIDKFLAATEVKTEAAGKQAGDNLGKGMASSASKVSPLIVSAIAGGLIAGGPVISAAGVLLFGGLAAVAASNVGVVQDNFSHLKAYVLNDVQGIATGTSGQFVAMAGDIQASYDRLAPSLHAALIGVAPELRDIVGAFMDGANIAVPAFTRAIQQGQPVVQGLDALIRDLASGVATMMDDLTAHSGAEGAVLSDLGAIVRELLGTLGQLAAEGSELGRDVLPMVVDVLRALNTVLRFVAPVLPEVAAGFAAFKIVGMLSGPLDTFAGKLKTVATEGEGMASSLAGKGASAVSGLAAALPALSMVVAAGVAGWEAYTQQVDHWADALNKGGAAEAQAKAQMADATGYTDRYGGSIAHVMDAVGMFAGVQNVANAAAGQASEKAKANTQALSPLERANQDVTKATNDLSYAIDKYGAGSDQAQAAAGRLSAAQGHLTTLNQEVKAATEGATTASQNQTTALQGIANTASSANTQIQLLKGALDALTGANMTADQAEIAVTQAVDAATQAVQGHSAALVFNHGQLDLTNVKSAQASQILMNLASTQHQEIATLEQQGASQDVVTQKSDAMRAQFIQVAIQMGANAQQAQALADRYFGIPNDVHTNIQAYDNASAVIQRVQNLLAGVHDKTIFLTTYSRVVSSGPAGLGGAALPQAAGGIVHMFAGGGFEPMRANIAQTVPPGTMRIIGDNPLYDEAYIPINDSPRSRAELAETAGRMGFQLVPNSDGGTVAPSRVEINGGLTLSFPNVQSIADPNLPRQLLTAIRDGIRKLEMEAR